MRDLVARLASTAGARLHDRLPPHTRLGHQLRMIRARLPERPTPLVVPRLLAAFARTHPDAVVVQVGANDGVKRDPLRRHLLARRWRAYLLEPVPEVFRQLEANVRFLRHAVPVNVAIGDHDGSMSLFHVPPGQQDARLPAWYDALGSYDREVVLGHAHEVPGLEQLLEETSVPCVTFETFARQHDLDRIDLLQIDTEGYDLHVLEQVDLERFRPEVVLYEHRHLDDAARRRAVELLEGQGYATHPEGFDTIAVKVRPAPRDGAEVLATWRRLVGPEDPVA